MAVVYDLTLFFLSPGPFPSALFFQLSLSFRHRDQIKKRGRRGEGTLAVHVHWASPVAVMGSKSKETVLWA